MATKKMKLDLIGTLKGLHPGDSITFTVAGEGQETTYNTLRTLKDRHSLNLSILSIDNGLKAIVTAL